MSSPADILPVVATGLAGAAAFFALGTAGAARPASTMWGPVVSRGSPATSSVALTFDDGPLPGPTDRVLDALGEAGVRAAFFVIGRCARRWPDLVRRMDAEGHLVGNHSFDHHLLGLTGRYRYWADEIRQTDQAIADVIGKRPAMFRPPMGIKHWHLMNAAADAGHAVVTWSRRALDGVAVDPARILARLVAPARAGDVMLLHDGVNPHLKPQDRAGTVAAVRPLISSLKERGLTPTRLDEHLALPAYAQPAPPDTRRPVG
jgi:peptidoglycan/xylan/chitin deacetylase (PgdA/CDA1 family)